MSKAHFATSDEHLIEGETIEAACSALVPHAEFLITWTKEFRLGQQIREVLAEEGWGRIGICSKCLNAELDGRYVYGIRERGEEVTEEAA